MNLLDEIIADIPAPDPSPTLDPQARGETLIDEIISETGRRAPGTSADLERILALPRRAPPISPASADWLKTITEHMTRYLRRPNAACRCKALGLDECITELLPVQAATLYEAPRAGGELGLIGVGHGKTGIDILLPMVMPACKTALLLIPPSLRDQFFKADYPAWSQHFRTPILAGAAPPWDSDVPVLHVMAYSVLSNEKSTDYLGQLRPDLVIGDEAHSLKNGVARGGKPPASGAGRVFRYLAENVGYARSCFHTGSMTTKSGCDYFHLSAFALGSGSPVPLDPDTADAWSAVIDPGPKPAPIGELSRLCEPGEKVRKGFSRRMRETAGVISTRESPVATPLVFQHRKVTVPGEVRAALIGVRSDDARPDGEPFLDEFQKAKCIRELSSGFYYYWTFPRGELVSVIDRWFAYRKAYMKELRVQLTRATAHLDSPLLLGRAARRWHEGYHYPTDQVRAQAAKLREQANAEAEDGNLAEAQMLVDEANRLEDSGKAWEPAHSRRGPLAVWESACWPEWNAVKELVKPQTATRWLSGFLVEDAAEWAREHRGIVFYENVAFGERLAQVTGMPHFGGGKEASEMIRRETGERSIIASRDAHGTGKNLQRAFSKSLIEYPMADAGAWEQTAGRTHRYGQKAAEVQVHYYAHTQEMRNALDKAERAAEYIEETTENAQKLNYGAWR
jgi:hypothetical protein